MRRSLWLSAAFVAVLAVAPVRAADHLVSATTRHERLAEATSARRADIALLGEALSSTAARDSVAALGLDVEGVRAALPALSDAELRDLAARARALGSDPAAGLDKDIHDLLVIFLVVAIVLVVLKAVD